MRSATVIRVKPLLSRAWPLARRYWFDALIVVGIGIGLAADRATTSTRRTGRKGPLWFDVIAAVVIPATLFFRRRFPFGAPAARGDPDRGLLVRRRAVHSQRVHPAAHGHRRKRAVRAVAAAPAGDRRVRPHARSRGHRRPQRSQGPHRELDLDQRHLRDRLARRLRVLRRFSTGGGGKGACPQGRARARGASAPGRVGGACAHRPRAARRRRAQRERHDRPGLGRPAPAQARAGTRARGAPHRGADGARGDGGDAPDGRRPAPPGGGARPRAAAEPRASGQAGRARP